MAFAANAKPCLKTTGEKQAGPTFPRKPHPWSGSRKITGHYAAEVSERATRHLDGGGRTGAALAIGVEVALAHSSKCRRDNTGFSPGGTSATNRAHRSFSEISRQPGRRCRSPCGARRAIGPKNTRRSTSSGQRPANAPATIVPQVSAISDRSANSWRPQMKRTAASSCREQIDCAAERRMSLRRLGHSEWGPDAVEVEPQTGKPAAHSASHHDRPSKWCAIDNANGNVPP